MSDTHGVEGRDLRVEDVVLEFLEARKDVREARSPPRPLVRTGLSTRRHVVRSMLAALGNGKHGLYWNVQGKRIVG